jgi:hypothetical protein
MKKLLTILFLLPTILQAQWTDMQVIEAMAFIESRLNPRANSGVGDIGYLQIRKSYVDEVNQYSKTKFYYGDRFSRERSIQMVLILWNTKLKNVSLECRIRRHNGGINGCSMESTIAYYKAVMYYLNKNCV